MLTVDMSCDHNFIFIKGFLRKLHRNFVCELRLNFVTTGEALHQMIVEPSVVFVEQVLSSFHRAQSQVSS